MVQHTGAFHDIECAVYRAQREQIGLREFDSRQPQFLRLAPGIAKTGRAEVHRQDMRLYTLGNFQGELAGAAADAENVRNVALLSRLEIGQRESLAQISGNGTWPFRARNPQPTG